MPRTKAGLLVPSGPTIVIPRKVRTVADLLCGAGGSFSGTDKALRDRGFDVLAVAVNHWDMAIATHQANHPSVKHFTTGIDEIDPEAIVNEYLGGYVDYLMGGLQCTHFSRARGGKPVNDQQRSHAHAIIRWITRVPVRRLIIENVMDWVRWGPICELAADHEGRCDEAWPPAAPELRCNKPIKERQGEYFQAWLADLHAAGWSFQWWPINAANYGVPQTRVRFIGVGQRNRGPVYFPAPTHCDPKKLEAERAKRMQQGMFTELELKPWVPAAEIIDWSDLGASLYDSKSRRKAPNTLRRLARGAKEHWGPFGPIAVNSLVDAGLAEDAPEFLWAQDQLASMPHHQGIPIVPFVLDHKGFVFGNRMNNVPVDPSTNPVPTTTTATGGGVGIGQLDLAPVAVSRHSNEASRDVTTEPALTVTTSGMGYLEHGALAPVDALVVGQHGGSEAKLAGAAPAPVVVAISRIQVAQTNLRPVPGLVIGQQGGSEADSADASPAPTVPTAGFLRVAQALIAPYYSKGSGETCTSTERPMPTIPSNDRFAKTEIGLTPFVDQFYGQSAGTPRAASSVDEPVPAVPTANRFAVVNGMILQTDNGSSPEAGRWSDGTRGVDEPTTTVASGGNLGFAAGLMVPFGPKAEVRSTDQPAHTATSKDRLAVAPGVLVPIDNASVQSTPRSAEDPFPTMITQENVGLSVATIVPHWNERDGQTPRIHSVNEPAPAMTSRMPWIARPDLVIARDRPISTRRLVYTADGVLWELDICFRMFKADTELPKAQAFPGDYLFIGNKSERTKQIGNAVPPPIMEAFVGAQEDADARMLVQPLPITTATPLPAGRTPASIRTSRRRGAA